MSKRYGCLPSDLLKLDISDLEFNLLVMDSGLKFESKQAKEMEKKIKSMSRSPRRSA